MVRQVLSSLVYNTVRPQTSFTRVSNMLRFCCYLEIVSSVTIEYTDCGPIFINRKDFTEKMQNGNTSSESV